MLGLTHSLLLPSLRLRDVSVVEGSSEREMESV